MYCKIYHCVSDQININETKVKKLFTKKFYLFSTVNILVLNTQIIKTCRIQALAGATILLSQRNKENPIYTLL